MARSYVSMSNLRFLLHDVHQVQDLLSHEYFSHCDRESLDMMLDAALQIGDTYLFPFYQDMDRNQPELEGGTIRVHSSVKPYLEAAGEGGWIGALAPLELGGMQLPQLIGSAAGFIMSAANNGATGFTGLTTGAANLIISFATDEQKAKYLPKMFAGEWQGTMALTEPQAGSSLSDVITTATPMPDGSYRIRGQKIYISAGDYIGTENVVHMLLARIDGAPKGTKGISLFIVPKYRDGEQGELVFNDITTAGVYHKMGQHGTPATHLMFGERDDCHGYLVGEPNKGLGYMFQMMNEARIMVGLGACSIASAAYHASLQYAMERPQGRRLNNKDLDAPQTLIINHPDVRRMLLFQRAIVEGGLSLVMECSRYADLMHVSEGEEHDRYELLLELLTPVVKTFPSEMGVQSVSAGLQVLGGGGFCEDFPLENYYRDIRIYPIYEGTTGIQSQDLLGRKVTMQQGKAVMLLAEEIQKTIREASAYEDLRKQAGILGEKLKATQEILMHLMPFAMKGDIERYLADATLFMEFFGIVTVAWQWLKQGIAAKQALLTRNPQGEELEFYEGKLLTMRYYFAYEVPKTLGLLQRLKDDEVLTIVTEKTPAL
ncbi:MAG: acyl-CoA dehydrogenase [Bacteroidia bacterium]|nr:acyl-CoA dehydrogenase [Bacteroidia bacterium]